METFGQSVLKKDKGEPLPTVWESLAEAGIHWFRGSLHLTAAASGVGKSLLALNHLMRCGVRGLYLSMDTPRWITVERAKGIAQYMNAELSALNNVRTFYRTGGNLTDLVNQVGAYGELYGTWPELIVVDNLVNVSFSGDSEYHGQRAIMAELDLLAKDTRACVHVLTHVAGKYRSGFEPISQDGVQNKITEMAHQVLTLRKSQYPGELLVSLVKSRTGECDMTGVTYTPLRVDPQTLALV